MVNRGEGTVRTTDGAGGETKAFECLGGCYFVDEVAVDVEEGGHAIIFDYVIVPDFVVESSRSRRGSVKGGAGGKGPMVGGEGGGKSGRSAEGGKQGS